MVSGENPYKAPKGESDGGMSFEEKSMVLALVTIALSGLAMLAGEGINLNLQELSEKLGLEPERLRHIGDQIGSWGFKGVTVGTALAVLSRVVSIIRGRK